MKPKSKRYSTDRIKNTVAAPSFALPNLIRYSSISLLLVMMLNGCMIGPDYQRPSTVATTQHSYTSLSATLDASDRTIRWWQSMNDPDLDAYIARLISDNLQLKEAAARIRQAWEQRAIAQSNLLPSLSSSADASRSFQTPEGIGSAAGSKTSRRIYSNAFSAGLSTAWQIDLFGKIRRSINAADALYKAEEANSIALLHSLIAELAQRRIAIASLQRQIELTQRIIKTRSITLETVETRYKAGANNVSSMDVYLARANLAAARADIPSLKQQLAEQTYALDVLLGQAPGTTDPFQIQLPLLPPPLDAPVGVPAQLLDRRPDLRTAELKMISATQDIGIAIADLFPDLTLQGSFALQSSALDHFFDSQNLAGSILSDILMRIYQGGRLRANIRLQEYQVRELAAAYAGVVLNAMREVEIALTNEQLLLERVQTQKERLEAIRKTEETMEDQYSRGIRTIFELLDVQERHYLAEQAYLLAAQAKWQNRIALYLALGGDWFEITPDTEMVPVPEKKDDTNESEKTD